MRKFSLFCLYVEVKLILILLDDTFCLPAHKITDIWEDEDGNSENSHLQVNIRTARVLNFFPVPVEEECRANDGRRTGVCMNTYECRIKNGKSFGPCALGFGVCCVFRKTCNEEASNNITYFVNPDFPDLSHDMSSCSLTIQKMDPEIAQFRLDFIHFNLGQPNRKTGVCEDDVFLMTGLSSRRELKLCGLNSGQHVYFDVDPVDETITVSMNLSRRAISRLWEVRVTQIPFNQRAPAGCLQYHTGVKGIIQTMNFADNGRHLANQDYNICMRQEEDMCSIAYEPCHDNAFKIAPNNFNDITPDINSINNDPSSTNTNTNQATSNTSDSVTISNAENQNSSEGPLDESLGDTGSGDFASQSRQFETCSDKIILPCESDDLIMTDGDGSIPGFCDVIHCGSSLCPPEVSPCRIETSAKPFTIGVHFGPTAREVSPDENLGMCLIYEQLPCNV